jgi:hypothetical protein
MRNMYEHPAYVPHGIMKIIPFWEYRYPRTFIGLGLAGILALVVMGAILLAYVHDIGAVAYAWAVALFAASALRGWVAYQLTRFVQS